MDSSVEEETCLMETHFLKPYVTSIDGSVAELPRNRFSVSSSSYLKDSFSRISFTGFWSPHDRFNSWAAKMEALHEPTWRKAGIFEAIKASIYKIRKNRNLTMSLVEKWCPETKSFIFPWGEATITLEDVMVLLGFSVLGTPVFKPLESSEMREAVKRLEKERLEKLSKSGMGTQVEWVSSFRNRDDSMLEHEVFLALWLSRFVFPELSRSCISTVVLPIAVRLARGEKMALAPSILASIYRDLGQIQAFARDKSSTQNLKVNSLFKLVLVWAWERFRKGRPEAIRLHNGEPRIARWNRLFQRWDKLSFDDFEWRPYAQPLENWNPPRFYLDKGKWMTVDDSLDDEFVSFARCLRVSQLVGIGFVEDYYPHRVGMQFGLSQDLPGLVINDYSNLTKEEAWEDYDKPLDGSKLYVPSRFATTSVTARYQDWWLKSVSEFLSSEEPTKTYNARTTVDDDEDDDAPPKVLLLSQVLQKLGEGLPANLKRRRKHRTARHVRWDIKKGNIGDCGGSDSREAVPLGELFQKEVVKRTSEHLRNKQARDDDDDSSVDCNDIITVAKMINSRKKTGGGSFKSLGKRTRKFVVDGEIDVSASKAEKKAILDDGTKGGEEGLVHENGEKKMQTCDDEVSVNAEKKKTTVDDDAKEVESLLHEVGEKLITNDDDETVSKAHKKRKLFDDNVADVNESNAKMKTTVDDGTKEVESLLQDGEKQRSNDDDERFRQRKVAIEELALNLEARMMKVEKTLAIIRKWKTRRDHIQTRVSA